MNPASRSFHARFIWTSLLEELERRGVNYDFALTHGLGDATRLARKAARAGFETVVAVGGDGTINEVVNGLFDEEATISSASMGVLYTGTSPDFCGCHRIPTDPEAAIGLLLSGQRRRVDVCRITHRSAIEGEPRNGIFSVCANFGLGAAVARGSNCGLRKVWGDFLGTLLSIGAAVAGYKAPDFLIRFGGREFTISKVYNIFVGKSSLVASGIKLGLDIAPDDGKLYFLSVHGITRLRLFAILPAIYTGGIARLFPARFGSEIEIIEGGSSFEVEYDGDPQGVLPARITVLPRALELIRP